MNQEHYLSLIIRQLSGTLNEAQTAELNEWLSQSEENRTIKHQLLDSWKKADNYKKDIHVEELGAWDNINSTINDKTKVIALKPKTNIFPLWKKSLMIAASLAVLFTCSWLFLLPGPDQTLRYTTNGMETLDITLPDGSLVTLNNNSQLTYLETNKKRTATLAGEALFEVSHDEAHPFTVKSHQTTTTVLGTKFNINARDQETIFVSLFAGKVSFEATNQEALLLAPGEMASYTTAGNKIVKTVIRNDNTIAWKTKELKFKNDHLDQVVQTLEKYFDKNIELVLRDSACQFTGSFKNPDYSEVIEVLKYTFDLEFKSSTDLDRITVLDCKISN